MCILSDPFISSRGHFAEALFIVGVVGAHPAVPEVEVEAEVPLEAVMVLDVVRGRVQELPQP